MNKTKKTPINTTNKTQKQKQEQAGRMQAILARTQDGNAHSLASQQQSKHANK